MRTLRRGVTAAVAILFLGGAASAQQTPRGLVEVREGGRHGFWGGLGVGAGGEGFDLRDGAGYSDELYRPTISLRLGGTPSQYVRLGGEILAWIDDQGRQTESVSSILFVGQFYPSTGAGLYLKGGLGVGRHEVDFDDGFGVGDTGFAGLVGAGRYELPLAIEIGWSSATGLHISGGAELSFTVPVDLVARGAQ